MPGLMNVLMRSVLLVIFAVLVGCASRPTTKEVVALEPDCEHAEEQIAVLDDAMVEAHEKVAAGATSIIPGAVILNLIRGRWGTNKDIAIGRYEKELEKKIVEITTTCGVSSKMMPPGDETSEQTDAELET